MPPKSKEDCGCGGGKYNCLSENTFAKWVKEEKKRLDCGCGCKGEKAFKKKYKLVGGKILADCPPGFRNDGLTCLEECKPGEVDDGLTCRNTNPPGPGWVNDGLTFRDTNPPGPGWVNDGLTFRNANCPPGFVNDGLTCRKPIVTHVDDCPPGFRTEPLTCFKDLRCWQTGNPWKPVWDPDHQRTHCEGPESRSRNPRTEGGEVIGQEIRGQEIRPHPIRSKEIKGRVNFDELFNEVTKGLTDLFSNDGALARAFDPEKNGVADAFRKFGDDMKRVLEDVGNRIKDGFKKMGDAAKAAFEEMARNAERDFKQFGDDFVRAMKDPDFWVEAVGIMAMIAGAALSIALTVGTLGIGAPAAAGLMAAAAMVGPAARMIAAGARGEPIDALDIASIAIAGATAMIPGMGPSIQTAMKVGTTAASFAISAAKVGQDLGLVPSTCLANCPPPPDFSPEPPLDPKLPPSSDPPPPGQKTDEEILALAPPCTFLRVVGKPHLAPPCNAMPRETRNGPPHYTEDEWIRKYRDENYGTSGTGPAGALVSPEDQAIANATNVSAPTGNPVVLGSPDEDELDLDLDLGEDGELDLDLDLGEDGELDLDLDLGEDGELDLDLDLGEDELDLGLDFGDTDLPPGELPTLSDDDLPKIEIEGGEEELDLGEGVEQEEELNLDLAEEGAEEALELAEEGVEQEEELNLDLIEEGEEKLDLGEAEVAEEAEEGAEEEENLDLVLEPEPTEEKKPKVPFAERPLEAACYANRYPDVKSFYKIDPNNITEKNKEDLLEHWNTYGKRQGRNPSCGSGKGPSLTLYYAKRCPCCVKFMPVWKKLRVPGVTIRMVEEQDNDELRVDAFPTVVYRSGRQMEKYTGPRTKAAIEKFLKNKLR